MNNQSNVHSQGDLYANLSETAPLGFLSHNGDSNIKAVANEWISISSRVIDQTMRSSVNNVDLK